VYKLRVISPRSRDAPQRNKAHMEYIGKRPGIVLNESDNHGLFGVVDGKNAEDIRSIRELSRHIEEKTRNGTIAYRAVISLTEADALWLGYDDPDKWRDLVCERMPDMCDKLDIKMQNLTSAAAIHRDKGHPHVHILFWDIEQDVRKQAFVQPKIANAIRVGLIRHIFAEELSELQTIKNEARQAAVDGAGGFFGEFADSLAALSPEEYSAAVNRLRREGDLADSKLIYSRFNTADMKSLCADLLRLCECVPSTGRLYLKLMPPDVKDKVLAFVEKLLNTNVDCEREFRRYISAAVELCKHYTDNPETHDKAGQAAYDEMLNRLGNAVLRGIKRLNQQKRGMEWDAKRESYRREVTESLITELFGMLSRFADAEENKLAYAYRTGELSKQARKELAIRLENTSGYDWER
jgi:hypothetical protein